MNSSDVTTVLNRLLVLHHRSLPMYLGYASPWWARNEEAAAEVLSQIVEDQKQVVDRVGEMILEYGGDMTTGEFPLVYTAYHDVSFDFLLPKLIEHQKRAVAMIEHCSQRLEGEPRAKALADEALGAAKAHLESLQELSSPPLAIH